ncbi:MAG: 16S rRNA (guanine(966)-N(2))-methyltransferase RsmD [Planctomycetota bacterium]
MRIIAGQYRGRKLLGPADQATRPVTDRVKQRIFDWLAPRLDGEVVYDCFAGTGSFGLEALSRGARRVVFFERHRPAIERLRRNIDTLGASESCELVTGDVTRLPPARWDALPPAAVIFFDPPYRLITDGDPAMSRLLQMLTTQLERGGIISIRHDANDDPPAVETLTVETVRNYGSMSNTLLARST